MNGIHQQVAELQKQVHQIYLILHHLSEYVGWQEIEELGLSLNNDYCIIKQLTNTVTSVSNHNSVLIEKPELESQNHNQNSQWQEVTAMMQDGHKDILADPTEESQSCNLSSSFYREDENVSCEDKVQRLTAQLTAAYHRIANLEEQLIANRQSPETRQHGFYYHH